MTSLPIAAFLAGALLTLLLPVGLLIALVVWYWAFSVRVPETADGTTVDQSAPAGMGAVPTAAAGAEAAVPPEGPESSETPGDGRGAGAG